MNRRRGGNRRWRKKVKVPSLIRPQQSYLLRGGSRGEGNFACEMENQVMYVQEQVLDSGEGTSERLF
jgi:hypothetical protein